MRDIVLERFAAFKINSEGGVPHLYVDTRDYVTVGIGCLIKNVAQARQAFQETQAYWRVEGRPGVKATADMMEQDFNACVKLNKDKGGNLRSRAYAPVTQLRLTTDGINAFTKRKMKAFEGTLFKHLSRAQWADFPADAQFCCIAMMWGPGVWSTVAKKHPQLAKAIKNEDFLEAAKHIDFKSNGNDKVRKFLNTAYEFLLTNAAASMPAGCRNKTTGQPNYFLNPNVVYWPKKWIYDAESELAYEDDVMADRI